MRSQDPRVQLAKEHQEAMQIAALKNRAHKQLKSTKIGRNQPCPCNSGKKYKKCCLIY
jgi:uncharacterized protein YecA (UPF0149 family)